MAITFVSKTWTDQIITRLARTVSYQAVTETYDPVSGASTLSHGSASNISAVFLRRRAPWTFDKEGEVEGGDAYLIVSGTGTAVAKNDHITVDSRTYRVEDVIIRYSDDNNATATHRYCNLFLVT